MSQLKENKLYFKMRGKIGGLTEERLTKNTRDDDKKTEYGFSIKTDRDNVHYVKMTQWKSQIGGQVTISKKTDGNYENQKIGWDQRNQELKDGWTLAGVSLKEKAPEGKEQKDVEIKHMVALDAIEFIKANFKDGDSVFISGSATAYESKNGTVYKNFEVNTLYATGEDVNFEADDFEEMAEMSGELIFASCSPIGADFSVDAFYIGYNGRPTPFELLIPVEEKETAHAIMGGMEYGEGFRGHFKLHNRVVYKEVQETEEKPVEEKSGGMLFGKKAKSFETNTYTKREVDYEFKHVELLGIEAKTENKYTYDQLTDASQPQQKVEQPKNTNEALPWQ